MSIHRKAGATALALAALAGTAWADAGHPAKPDRHMSQMREHMGSMGGMMGEGMLAMPEMDPARGRKVSAEKGCVVCHSVNGIGARPDLRVSSQHFAGHVMGGRTPTGTRAMIT